MSRIGIKPWNALPRPLPMALASSTIMPRTGSKTFISMSSINSQIGMSSSTIGISGSSNATSASATFSTITPTTSRIGASKSIRIRTRSRMMSITGARSSISLPRNSDNGPTMAVRIGAIFSNNDVMIGVSVSTSGVIAVINVLKTGMRVAPSVSDNSSKIIFILASGSVLAAASAIPENCF